MTFSEFLTVFVPPSVAASAVAALASWFFKLRLDRELAAYTVQLEQHSKEQVLRATLATERVHRVYSKAMRLLRRAEGRMFSLSPKLRAAVDAGTSRMILAGGIETTFTGNAVQEIVEAQLFGEQQDGGALDSPETRLLSATTALQRAKNHLIFEGLFITEPVYREAWKIIFLLQRAHEVFSGVPLEKRNDPYALEDYSKALGKVAAHFTALERMMREDLLPRAATKTGHNV